MSGGQDINPFEEKQAAPTPQPTQPPMGNQGGAAADPFGGGDGQAPQSPAFYDGGGGTGPSQEQSVPYNPAYGAPGGQQQQTSEHNEPLRYEGPGAGQQQQQGQQQPNEQSPAPLQDDVPPARELQTSKFWRFEFYQQFFDVDTKDVLRRVSNTFVPVSPPDFLLHRNWHANSQQQGVPVDLGVETGSSIERSPDLYGPFWLCTTLWITIAIVGNVMSKISHSHQVANKVEGVSKKWSYDFQVASVAAITIYTYWAVMSLIIMALMKWKNLPINLIDTLALYGYSMGLWVLAAILCVAPIALFQWLVCFVAGLWSSAYLLMNMWHVWKSRLEKTWFIAIVLLVFVFHMLLSLSFKFYFLNYNLN